MSSGSNTTIESAILQRAIDDEFTKLIQDNPKLADVDLRLLKNVYGHGFVSGVKHGAERVGKLLKQK